jgi:beta-glucosidase
MLGGWAAAGRAQDAVTILQGIRNAVSPGTEVLHVFGAGVTDPERGGFDEAVRAARQADAVVTVVGEHHDMSSEALNRSTLDLPGVQNELVEAVYATGTPVVAVLVNGRPLSVSWLDENVPAVLETWFLGVEMGNAVADVLFGDVNPSGKLPVTFPRTVGQVPLYYAHKNTGRPPDPDNRYTSKYIDVPWTSLYPFGYGLSYTTFDYESLDLSASRIHSGESLKVTVDVVNTGGVTGVEVVQLYLRDDVASVTRPVKELKGFERVALAPGERKTVEFEITPEDLRFLGMDLKPVIEPGTFTVFVGGSSDDVIEAQFEVIE